MSDDIESRKKQIALFIRNNCDKETGSQFAGAGGRTARLSLTEALSTFTKNGVSHHLILHRPSMLTSLREGIFLTAGKTRHMRTVSSPTDI